MRDFDLSEHEEDSGHRWFGKYRAFVRDNCDPERLGRCRLEIPAVLGIGEDNWSDWASPCFPYGGIDNAGMFLVPEEGASVWAEFEGGNASFPIWSGVWLAGSNPGEQPDESKRLCDSASCAHCPDRDIHAKSRLDNAEHAHYHGHPPYYCPKMKVLIKTAAGHVIYLDDRDKSSCVVIADKAGSSIKMDAKSGDITIRAAGKLFLNP